ncbi:3-deoxy-D-manno-octulosonic acid transferase [Pseudohalioglobus sediminis]|uniref:3-deoxy-D-manno-octulosonic acid transferase n=1 Tax=Pseudohalioglobus sediminis TaxID=2606449 RepID=A0A5B0WU71_9GAMM|nr:lipid IV(A) 3-deoxy-D-manno-octulosonic acid transferase [Pseudohalioglobus sediminis]KAA1190632.1 3-deoxy-D-manno-octulosonic acid transferase [Pseudohalioglobus sediminis]
MRYLYSALFYALLPLLWLRMLLRSRRAPAYRQRLAERLGVFQCPREIIEGRVIWVHAVSVGEALAAVPLVEELLAQWPEHSVVMTTTTPTGSERVRAQFGARVFHVYAPWDIPGAVQRFLARVRPELLIIMETELWPNMIHYSKRGGCRIVLANARLSARSARGYARFAGLTGSMLAGLDRVACQSEADGERLLTLGLEASRLRLTGSIKFDIELDAALRSQAQSLRVALGQRPVLLASSTHQGEDEVVLDAFCQLRQSQPQLLCLIVPRHPERFESVYALCQSRGLHTARRSQAETVSPEHAVLLGDTMGELRLLSGVATVCVIGGSFIEHGGQNVLEAAAWGVPVVSGPHMFNFSEITELLLAAGGMIQVADAGELTPTLRELLADENRRRDMGHAAEAVVDANRGALARLLELVGEVLESAGA